MKMTKIYTRTGDKGTTSLVGGVRIKKSNIRLEAYGTIDELTSHIGLLVALLSAERASTVCPAVLPPEQEKASRPAVLPPEKEKAPRPAVLPPQQPSDDDRALLVRTQSNLFIVGSHLATDQSKTPLYPSAILPEGETALLEQRIDQILASLPEPQGFILPGGTVAAAQCHVCRTVCRRAERHIDALADEAIVGEDIIKYVNRLSDYLFVLAKKINHNAGQPEIVWQKPV